MSIKYANIYIKQDMTENKEENYDDIHSELRDIKSIVIDTRELLINQGEYLESIAENVEETVEITKNSNRDMKSVMKNMGKSSMLYGSIAGMALLTPIGLGLGLTGLPLGLLCSAGGIVGFLIGGMATYQISSKASRYSEDT